MRVAINGFGRIGRCFLRAAMAQKDIEVVAINDLGDLENLAYLLKYDTAYRAPGFEVGFEKGKTGKTGEKGQNTSVGALIVGGKTVMFLSERDPLKLPWKDLNIDVVVESTGVFDSFEKASAHRKAGAKKVVISAPVKDAMPNAATVLMGVNEDELKQCTITSNASCTTNAGSPLIAILDETLGIEKAVLNTVHAYTATQSVVDSPAKGDFRRGRAAAQNISPSTTGAAIAVTKAYPSLKNKFDGIAIRVPAITGSLVDITFISKKQTNAEEVNGLLENAALEERWEGIFSTTREPIVSSDIIGAPYASIADLAMTRVIGGNLVKVLAWYDNEMGYTYTLLRHVMIAGASV